VGIKLDWEVESEGGWNEVGEDGQAASNRRRRLRRIRNALVGVLFLAALAAGGVAWRLRQVGRQLQADLESTVAAETLALRIGDREGFIAVQSDLGGWQRAQERTFDEYQALAPSLEVPGEVLEMEVEARQAQVVLREVVDGQPYRVRWFYEHTDQGWRHVPAPVSAWGEQTALESDHFTVVYHLADDTFARSVVARLSNWWATACLLTRCEDSGEPPRFEVRIEPDSLAEVGWASYDENTLFIPSPLLGRIPEGEAADPALWRSLARLFAGHWLDPNLAESPQLSPDEEWANEELAAWLAFELDNSLPPSTVFGPLVAAYGLEVVPDYRAALGRGEEVLPALQGVTNTPLSDLPIEWGAFFAYRLRAEAQLIDSGHPTEAEILYHDAERYPDLTADVRVEKLARPASITVLGTRTYSEVTWAEVLFVKDSTGESLIAYEPFRIVDGRWLHTVPQMGHWGNEQWEEGAVLRLGYYELDAAHVERLLPQLDGVYSQVAADLGIAPELLPIEVVLAPSGASDFRGYPPEGLTLLVPSPYATARPADTSAPGYVALAATHDLVEGLVSRQIRPYTVSRPVAYAFVSLEMERTGLPTGEWLLPATLEGPIGVDVPPSLETLWSGSAVEMPYYSAADYLAARLLMDMLVEAYGPEAIPDLLARLPDSANVDDWLTRSVGVEAGALEADWRARLETALQE
jgi:hypothetical protein